MRDGAEGAGIDPPAPRRTAGWAWALAFLAVIVVVVDLLATYTLGNRASQTFQTVPAKKQNW